MSNFLEPLKIKGKQPNHKTKLFAFIRNYRIENRILLFDMAKKLGYESAELSGIETSRYPVPNDFYHKMINAFHFTESEKKELKIAISEAKQ